MRIIAGTALGINNCNFPQSFDRPWMDEFLAITKTEPAWLAGLVYGPQTRLTLEERLRRSGFDQCFDPPTAA